MSAKEDKTDTMLPLLMEWVGSWQNPPSYDTIRRALGKEREGGGGEAAVARKASANGLRGLHPAPSSLSWNSVLPLSAALTAGD